MRLPVTIAIRRSHPLAWLLCQRDVVTLTLSADGRLFIERQDGTRVEADVHPETTVFPWLVVLLWRAGETGLESLALPRAATGAEAHRQLRLWLKWQAGVRKA
jgi:hypothetical protein